jgi:selenocysteine-specific elongation factor
VEAALFDAAFEALVRDEVIEQRGERVRAAGDEWKPPADVMAGLSRLEKLLEADGLSVPDNATWQKALGKEAGEIAALGFFLERLVRVTGELTYTSAQIVAVREKLDAAFARKEFLAMSEFKDALGVSRKYSVPLAEHCDRVGWTRRVGDERRRG